jgi:hypothetical protein
MIAYKLTYHNVDHPDFSLDESPYNYVRGDFFSTNSSQHGDLTKRKSNQTQLGVKPCNNSLTPIAGLDISNMRCINKPAFNLSGQTISQEYT